MRLIDKVYRVYCIKCKEPRFVAYKNMMRIKSGYRKGYCLACRPHKTVTSVNKQCIGCDKSFRVQMSRIKLGRGKYCSRDCAYKAYHPSGEKHFAWKGNSVGYYALHTWVQRKLGKPSKCSECGTANAKRFEWANISGEYKRDLADWKRLCSKCHIAFDDILRRGWETRHAKNDN